MADAPYYVYMLRCADGSLYTGSTPEPARRLRQHCGRLPGGAKYTRSHPVAALAALWRTDGRSAALRLEARVKRLTHAQKAALIAGDAALCPALAELAATRIPGASLEEYLEHENAPDA